MIRFISSISLEARTFFFSYRNGGADTLLGETGVVYHLPSQVCTKSVVLCANQVNKDCAMPVYLYCI